MAEVWAAAAAVVAAGASAYGSYEQGQAAKSAASHVAAPISMSQVTEDSARGNISAEPDIEALIRSANSFNQKQNLSLLNKAIPGYGQIQQNLSQQALSFSQNPYQLPTGVADNLTRLAAERGINTGVKGQAQDYSLLRDFGVNLLNYGQQNINNTQSILGTLAGLGKVNPLSPLSFYGTPGQYFAGAQSNQNLQQSAYNAQGAANMYATANDWNSIAKLAGTAATYAGSGSSSSQPGSYSGDTSKLAMTFCWVAREVYGTETNEWREFRDWMTEHMPIEFVEFYQDNGEEIARHVARDEDTKTFIRGLMDELKKRR